jgi:hypothetical protein
MSDHRVKCKVEYPKGSKVLEANAFRSIAEGGNEFLLDFIQSSLEKGTVVARLRVRRDVLQSICERMDVDVRAPKARMFSVPLEV